MYLNDFSVRIPEGVERTSGYVEMTHGSHYTINLRNNNDVRCDAVVSVDGKHVGTFRIDAHGSMTLERPSNDTGRFTFYRRGTKRFREAELDQISRSDLGCISVEFRPECACRPTIAYTPHRHKMLRQHDDIHDRRIGSYGTTEAMNCCFAAGGTGLSGHSDQKFVTVAELVYDTSRFTTINLRLVSGGKGGEARPLKPVTRSTPIPPPVD